jgi:hypothetical protein
MATKKTAVARKAPAKKAPGPQAAKKAPPRKVPASKAAAKKTAVKKATVTKPAAKKIGTRGAAGTMAATLRSAPQTYPYGNTRMTLAEIKAAGPAKGLMLNLTNCTQEQLDAIQAFVTAQGLDALVGIGGP